MPVLEAVLSVDFPEMLVYRRHIPTCRGKIEILAPIYQHVGEAIPTCRGKKRADIPTCRGSYTNMSGKRSAPWGFIKPNFLREKKEKRILMENSLEKKKIKNKKSVESASPDSSPKPPKKAPPTQLVLLGEEHSGRDEMNLAGHPFALLQSSGRLQEQNEIVDEWPRTLPNGKTVIASWRVGTDAKFGLPGPTEELLYLVLLQLTRESASGGEWPQVVHFSRADLLRRLGWHDNPGRRDALALCFERLAAVNITTRWAFWDARAKNYVESSVFHILDSSWIVSEPPGRKTDKQPLSWFRWNDILFASFLAGNVRSLALDFTISLDLPTSRRLFRFLDMHRHSTKPPRDEFSISVMKLRDKLGMTGYAHVSKVKEKLAAAHAELIERGYLKSVEWEKTREGETLAFYAFQNVEMTKDTTPTLSGAGRGFNGPRNGISTGGLDRKSPGNAENDENSAFSLALFDLSDGLGFNHEPNGSGSEGTDAPESVWEPDFDPETLAFSGGSSPSETCLWARQMRRRYDELPPEIREALLAQARGECGEWMWDRVENPDSPASLPLWRLVEEHFSGDK